MNTPQLASVLLGLTGEIAHLTTEVGHLAAGQVSPADVAELKTDVADLKTGQAVLQADVAELKADMVVVKADVAELKADMVVVKTTCAHLGVTTDHLSDQIRLVAEGHSVLLAEIAKTRDESERRDFELRDLILLVHKDLCGRIDARLGGTNAPA